jgi:putative transposase
MAQATDAGASIRPTTGSSSSCFAGGPSRGNTSSSARWCFSAARLPSARETGAASERTLQRRAAVFDAEGMESLFGSEHAKPRRLPPSMRRLIVDLKAGHPGLNPNEISRICYVRFGRGPARKTIKRVLAEEPAPLRMVRRFPPYHEIPEHKERRRAVVALHAEGWAAKAITSYLRVGTSTVYRGLKRWVEEGMGGLEDRPHGRPPGVRKVDLKAIAAVKRLQDNPNLGEFRVHATLAQMGIHLSPRTCGRILAINRALYGLDKPKGLSKDKRECRSRPPAGTGSGPPTCAMWTTTSSGARPTSSRSWRTTAAPCSPAPLLAPRTSPPTFRCSTLR